MTGRRPSEPTTLARVREVFASGGFGRFFATRAVSQVGDGIFQLATAKLLLFDNPTRNIALTLTLLSVVTLIPFSAISPFVGVFIDRWDRRKILARTPAIRAVLALLVTAGVGAHTQGVAFYILVLFILSANRLFLATMSAVLPQLVPEDDLLVANSVASTGGSISNVTGLGIGAALSQVMGGTRAAGIAGIAFIAAAALARGLPVRGRHERSGPAPLGHALRAVTDDMVDGIRHVRGAPRVVYALCAVSAAQLLVGLMTAATAVYFISVLHLRVGASTLLLGAIAAGIGVGVALVPWLAGRVRRRDSLIPISFGVAGLPVLITAIALSRPAIVVGGVFVGVAYAMTKIPVDTIVQEEMPDDFRGRAFAVYDMLFNFARVAGTAAAAAATSAGAGPRGLVVAAGAGYLIACAIFLPAERRLSGVRKLRKVRTVPQPPPLDLPVGEMVTVRSYSGHRADTEPRALVVGDREVPVEEICWRAIEERGGERRQIFVVRVGGTRVRIASSEESSRWEVERVITSKPTEKD